MGGNGSAPLAAVMGAGLVTTVATVFAIRADSLRPLALGWLTAFDVGVGLAFVLAAWLATCPATERWLMAGVGIVWLVASSVPVVGSAHQAVLLIALVAFPSGRLRRWPERVVAALAVPVAVGVVTQAGIAALFFGATVYLVFDRSRTTIGRTYRALACGSVAAALGAAWVVERFVPGRADPTASLVSYEVVLTAVAAAFPLASRAVIRSRMLLVDEALRAGEPAGLEGLTAVLRGTLRDGQLRIHLWDRVAGCYIDAAGQPLTEAEPSRRWLGVVANGEPVAVVESRSNALDDPVAAEGVASAVRLMVRNIQLQAHQRVQLAELDASRLRLLAATDRVRERVAADVTTGVQHPLAKALSSIRRAQRSTQDSEAAAALSIAHAELRGVRDDLAALVAGVPAFDLGDGMLRQALDTLALASPVPVEVRASDYAAADRQAETTLFYFCCEAVTNAVKHAAATRIRIEVRRAATGIIAVVSDDGKGGADPTTAGSGLRGLQDRLASIRGRLQVESSPGAGTRLTAVMPLQRVRRFSAMASL